MLNKMYLSINLRINECSVKMQVFIPKTRALIVSNKVARKKSFNEFVLWISRRLSKVKDISVQTQGEQENTWRTILKGSWYTQNNLSFSKVFQVFFCFVDPYNFLNDLWQAAKSQKPREGISVQSPQEDLINRNSHSLPSNIHGLC